MKNQVISDTKFMVRMFSILGGFFLLMGMGFALIFLFSKEKNHGICSFISVIFIIFGLLLLVKAYQNNKRLKKICLHYSK